MVHASGVHINFPTTEGAAGGLLQGLFDLSPAEARVACGIAERQTIEAIADELGVSRETVRCQLKSVLAKTGTKRQLDLALLLVGAGSGGFVGRFPNGNNPNG